MKIIPDIKATFGDTYFLGYTEKMKYDKNTNKKTEELDGYICRLSSSELQGQMDVIVPLTVAVQTIKFNQKVTLQGVVIDPYARSSQGTSFAEVVLRCTAKNIVEDAVGRTPTIKGEEQK